LLLIDFVFVPPETWARFGAPLFLGGRGVLAKFTRRAIAGASAASAARI
jgi:hypothetical protein